LRYHWVSDQADLALVFLLFLSAQRSFIISDIRLRAAALIVRRFLPPR
jgi:hypothetical protein